MKSRPDEKIEILAAGYYDRIYSHRRGMRSKWHHMKFDTVLSSMGDYGKHLDIGCGPGTLIGIRDSVERSVGLDGSLDQVEYARIRYGSARNVFSKYVITDDSELPFAAASFDIVTLIELLEHLTYSEISNLLNEVARVLTPFGRLIVTTPNFRGIWPFLELIVNKISGVPYNELHLTHFNRHILKSRLIRAGFSHVGVRGVLEMHFIFAAVDWRITDALERFRALLWPKRFGLLLLAEAAITE